MSTDILNSANTSGGLSFVNADLSILYGSDKEEEARIIDNASVVSIKITESIFGTLPILHLKLNDTMDYVHNLGFQIGQKLYIKITPNDGDKDKLCNPYVNTVFAIQGINYTWNDTLSDYDYDIYGIYAAEKYINATFQWPPSAKTASIDLAMIKNLGIDITPGFKTGGFTSEELLAKIVPAAGLAYVCDMSGALNPLMPTDDRMYWMNNNMTYQEYIKFVCDHAWISEDDAPLFYVNINGVGVYTSFKTFNKAAPIMAYRDKNYAIIGNSLTKDTRCRLYTDAMIKNAGYLQHKGGYKIKSSVYNPYAQFGINPAPEIPNPVGNVPFGSRLPMNIRAPDILPIPDPFHERVGTNIANPPYVGKMSNRSQASSNNVRYKSNDMYFMETHQYYDYAPLHNRSIRNAFFNVFAYVTVNCSEQLESEYKRNRIEGIGDKITIDFTDKNSGVINGSIQTGDFIIGSITHLWQRNGTYQQILCCVSDGINGLKFKNNDMEEGED